MNAFTGEPFLDGGTASHAHEDVVQDGLGLEKIDVPFDEWDSEASELIAKFGGPPPPPSVLRPVQTYPDTVTGIEIETRTGGVGTVYDINTEYVEGEFGDQLPYYALQWSKTAYHGYQPVGNRINRYWETADVFYTGGEPHENGTFAMLPNDYTPFPGGRIERPYFVDDRGANIEGPYFSVNFGIAGPLYVDQVWLSHVVSYQKFPRDVEVYGTFDGTSWTKIGLREGMIQPSVNDYAVVNDTLCLKASSYFVLDLTHDKTRPLYGIRLVILLSGGASSVILQDVRFFDTLYKNRKTTVVPLNYPQDFGSKVRKFGNIHTESLYVDDETVYIGDEWRLHTDVDEVSGSKRLKLSHDASATSHLLAHPVDGLGNAPDDITGITNLGGDVDIASSGDTNISGESVIVTAPTNIVIDAQGDLRNASQTDVQTYAPVASFRSHNGQPLSERVEIRGGSSEINFVDGSISAAQIKRVGTTLDLSSGGTINLTAGGSNSGINTTSTEFSVNNRQFYVLAGDNVSLGTGTNLYLTSGSVLAHGSYVVYQTSLTATRHYRIENTDGRRAYLEINGINFIGSGLVGSGTFGYDNAGGFVSNLSGQDNSHSFNIQNNTKMLVNNNGIFSPVQIGFSPRTTPSNSVMSGSGDVYVNSATNNLVYRYNDIDYPIAGPQEPVKIRAFSLPHNTDRFASTSPIYVMNYTLQPGNIPFSMSIGWNASSSGGKLEVYTSAKTPEYFASMNIEQSSSTSTNYAVYMGASASNAQSFTINSGYIDGDSLVKVLISPTSTTVFSPLLEITIHATETGTFGTDGPYRFIFKQYNEMEMLE